VPVLNTSEIVGLDAAITTIVANAASAHSHTIANVTGLQTALDAKQASGSYALTGHNHSGVYQPAGSYAAATHGHVIADVTGLQTALDAKQASGSYALASHNHSGVYQPAGSYAASVHSHVIADVTGLQAALDGKQAVGGGGGADPWVWAKLASDVPNSTVTLTTSGLSFTAQANTTYLVQLVGEFTSAATTTGIAAALSIPSGTVSGQGYHPVSATVQGSFEQVANNATTGATTGVRAANTVVPLGGEWKVNIGATGGVVTLNFRSEVAASAVTIKAGSALGARAI
jgi:hypothetical protein